MKVTMLHVFMLAFALLPGSPSFAQKKDCKSLTHGADIYKHFTGTIGKRKVAMDLRFGFCGGSNYGGSYLYDLAGHDAKTLIIGEPAKFEYDATLTASEYFIGDNWMDAEQDGGSQPATWVFTIKDGHLAGKWQSGDKKQTLDINLVEEYKNAVPLEIFAYRDSTKKYLGYQRLSAVYRFIGVKPSSLVSGSDAEFINGQLLEMTVGKKGGAMTFSDMPLVESRKCFDDFNVDCQRLVSDTPVSDQPALGGHNYYSMLFPIYNGDGFLVMECESFSTGSIKGMTSRNVYSCIDVARKKVWHLNDVVADISKLTELLRDLYRSSVKQGAREVLPADKITPVESMIVTRNGLVFCYPSADDMRITRETRVFVPYEKLSKVLTADFKLRMSM